MTGRPDAAWGTLAAGERNQVAVLMSLLTHESALAAVQAPPVALDPEGRKAAFSYVQAPPVAIDPEGRKAAFSYVDAAHAAGSGSGGARAKAGARKQAQVRDKVWSHPKAAL